MVIKSAFINKEAELVMFRRFASNVLINVLGIPTKLSLRIISTKLVQRCN